jgi:hypothetical protein
LALLYYTDADLEQLENRINKEFQWKWNFWDEQQNTCGKITKPMRIFYHNLKLTQLQRTFKIAGIIQYNMLGERTKTDWHTLLWNINHAGNKVKDEPSKEF